MECDLNKLVRLFRYAHIYDWCFKFVPLWSDQGNHRLSTVVTMKYTKYNNSCHLVWTSSNFPFIKEFLFYLYLMFFLELHSLQWWMIIVLSALGMYTLQLKVSVFTVNFWESLLSLLLLVSEQHHHFCLWLC